MNEICNLQTVPLPDPLLVSDSEMNPSDSTADTTPWLKLIDAANEYQIHIMKTTKLTSHCLASFQNQYTKYKIID